MRIPSFILKLLHALVAHIQFFRFQSVSANKIRLSLSRATP
jgi:hypothetical protein